MAETKIRLIDSFYGGMVGHDDKPVTTPGACLNLEEMDIYSNRSYMEPETIFAADNTPTKGIFSYVVDDSANLYALGQDGATPSKAKVWKLANAGADNPADWAALFTSANDMKANSCMAFHITTESGTTKRFLYYITGGATGKTLSRYGDLGATPTETAAWQTLSGLGAADDRPFMLIHGGELFILHGQFIAKIDNTAAFTEKAFTLPTGWEGVSACSIGDNILILARSIAPENNISMIFEWDRIATTGVIDQVIVPMGGPQVIVNHRETIRFICARNGVAKIFQLSGKLPVETHRLANIATEANESPIVPNQAIAFKENIFYFGLYKTDKSGVYAIGQVDEGKPAALCLSKRFSTTNYANHRPVSLFAYGPNFYASYFDSNATPNDYQNARIEGNNSPTRSSNFAYETIKIDGGTPYLNKNFESIFVITKPLAANTSISLAADVDETGSYTSLTRADGSAFNTPNGTIAEFPLSSGAINSLGKTIQVKLTGVSSATAKPSIRALAIKWSDANIATN